MNLLRQAREKYLEEAKSVGGESVLEAIRELESNLQTIDVDYCKREFADRYRRTGSFDGILCRTYFVRCKSNEFDLIKQGFERGHPEFTAHIRDLAGSHALCFAQIKPETLFH